MRHGILYSLGDSRRRFYHPNEQGDFGRTRNISVLLSFPLSLLPLFLLLLNFRPSVPQRHCPIEHELAVGGIGIDAEIPEPFKLVTCPGFGTLEAWLDLRGRDDAE